MIYFPSLHYDIVSSFPSLGHADADNPFALHHSRPRKENLKMTLWGSDTVKDVAESVGVVNLNKDVNQALCRDVEYRLSQVLEQALKFMRHAKRTMLWSQDISQALRALDLEPVYGYESTRPLRYGEASIGPGQPLFYVEDEEMDFEKLINAPLPKVPREISFTGESISWLVWYTY